MSEWAFRTLVAMTREVANPLLDVGAFLEVCMPIDMDRSRILCDLQEGKKEGDPVLPRKLNDNHARATYIAHLSMPTATKMKFKHVPLPMNNIELFEHNRPQIVNKILPFEIRSAEKKTNKST